MLSKKNLSFTSSFANNRLDFSLAGEINLYTLVSFEKELESKLRNGSELFLNLDDITSIDTAGAIYINKLEQTFAEKQLAFSLTCKNEQVISTLKTIHVLHLDLEEFVYKQPSFIEKLGEDAVLRMKKFVEFLSFFGQISYGFFYIFKHLR